MTEANAGPVTLMLEMRERLVRIETKMDSSAIDVQRNSRRLEDHEVRLDSLEDAADRQRTQIATLRWLGGGIVGLLAVFGDKLVGFIH